MQIKYFASNKEKLPTKGPVFRLYQWLGKQEKLPAYATLYAGMLETIRSKDSSYVDKAAVLVRDTLPDETILSMVGTAKYDIGLKEEGLLLLRKAVSIKPSIENIKLLVSRLDNDKYWSEKSSLCELLLKMEPNSVYAMNTKGWLANYREDWEEAKKCFQSAIEKSPKDKYARIGLGFILTKRGEYALSIEQYKKLLKHRDCDPCYVWSNLAYCNFMMRNNPEARKSAARVLSIDPEDELAQNILKEISGEIQYGIELFEDGFEDDAYPWLKIEAEKGDCLAKLYFASIETKKSKNTLFIDEATEKIGKNLSEDLIKQVKGAIYYDIGLKKEGIALMREAVTINPSRQNIKVFVSRLSHHRKYNEESLHFYDQLLTFCQSDIFALSGRGTVLIDLKRFAEAEDCLRQAIALDPADAEAHYSFAYLLFQRKEYASAISEMKISLDLQYWCPEAAWTSISCCLMKLGNREEALEAAEKALKLNPEYGFAKRIFRKLKLNHSS